MPFQRHNKYYPLARANFSFIHSNLRFICFLINIMHLKFISKINILVLCFIIYIKHQCFHVSIIILKAFFSMNSFFISIFYPYFCNLHLKFLSWMKHINILYLTYIIQYITNNFFFFNKKLIQQHNKYYPHRTCKFFIYSFQFKVYMFSY